VKNINVVDGKNIPWRVIFMKKRMIMTGIFSALLIFGIFFAGCSNGTTNINPAQLPADVVAAAASYGLADLPLPSGVTYKGVVDSGSLYMISWSGATQSVFEAYRDTLEAKYSLTSGTPTTNSDFLEYEWDEAVLYFFINDYAGDDANDLRLNIFH
jgi:hypothetical protein